MNQNKESFLLGAGLLAGVALSSFLENRRQGSNRPLPPVRAPGIKSWRMSKWVKHNGILRTQGLCGDFSKMPSSTSQQTAEALEKLEEILKEAGLARKHLIAITIYIADISPENFEEMNEVYDAWIDPQGLPTRLCVQAKMGHGAAVEIRAEACY